MKRALLAIAILSAVVVAGCEADESAPNHTARDNRNLLTPDNTEQQNAEKRAEENKPAEPPAGGSTGELPGQSAVEAARPAVAAGSQQSIQTLDQSALYPFTESPVSRPRRMAPGMVVPQTGMVIEGDWGVVAAMPEYPHRAWPRESTHYESGATPGNPLYFENLTQILSGARNNDYDIGTEPGNPVYSLIDIPWFYGNILAVPFLMAIDCPWAQRTTTAQWNRLVFRGYLPPAGELAPTPVPGVLHWEYPKPKLYPTTLPESSATSATQP